MSEVRVAIVGVGNCASAFLQGLSYYRGELSSKAGLTHPLLGGYGVDSICPVAAFDVDPRKVGRPLHEAVFALPNCARVFQPELPAWDCLVHLGPVLDGVAPHLLLEPEESAPRIHPGVPVDVARVLREARAEVLVSFLPVGSEEASRHYARACLEAGVALVNCMPAFLASDPELAAEFRAAALPMVGDDVKSQFGATILHRSLVSLMAERGVQVERSYQLNVGGNTDFLNMRDPGRLTSKRISKTEAVQSQLGAPIPARDLHVGPSDYVAWQEDTKVCFLRVEGRGFGDQRIEAEVRLSVQDSPNSAGIVIDAVRCAKLGLERGLGGPLEAPSAYFMKRPPTQLPDHEAYLALEAFISG